MGYMYMTLKGKLDILAGSDDSILYFIQTRSSVNFLCPSVMGRRIIEMTTLAKMDSHRHLAIDATGKNLTAPVEAVWPLQLLGDIVIQGDCPVLAGLSCQHRAASARGSRKGGIRTMAAVAPSRGERWPSPGSLSHLTLDNGTSDLAIFFCNRYLLLQQSHSQPGENGLYQEMDENQLENWISMR